MMNGSLEKRIGLIGTCIATLIAGDPSRMSAATKDWPLSALEAEGLRTVPIHKATKLIEEQVFPNIHSFLIVRNGKLVHEAYFKGEDGRSGLVQFDERRLHDTRSVSKSVTSLLIGIAIGEGFIESVDEGIASYFPDSDTLLLKDDHDQPITIRHLLTMTSGIEWDQSGAHDSEPESPNSEAQMENSPDFIEFVLSQRRAESPGARFNYNSGCSILLAGILREATGQDVEEFADEYLFNPLGIEKTYWWKDPTGLAQTHSGLGLLPGDMAKIGQLCLNGGRWEGRQIVPTSWIEESWAPQYGNDRYGLGWWLDHLPVGGKGTPTYAAEGNGGQFIFVMPEINLVVVFTGGNYGKQVAFQAYKITIDHVLSAIEVERTNRDEKR